MAANTREEVLNLARERIQAGVPPTVREIQEALGLKSVRSVQEHLARLIDDGKLIHLPGVSRGLRLPEAEHAAPAVLVPLVGQVQAGLWNFAEEHIEDHLMVHSRFAADELFALRVRGESMIEANILPDDIAVVRKQSTADSGQIVVALVEDEATLKIFRRRGRGIELHPANPAFPILKPKADELQILGKVIEIRRHLDDD